MTVRSTGSSAMRSPLFLIGLGSHEHMRSIADGVAATFPSYRPVLPDRSSVGPSRAGHWLRLLLGDDPGSKYPEGPLGPRQRLVLPSPRRCAAAWVVGQTDWVCDLVVDAAVKHSIPVTRMTPSAVGRLIAGGVAARKREQDEATQRVVDAVVSGVLRKPDFGGARAVVAACFAAESWRLGGGAMNYERALSKVSGGVGFREGAETMALRITKAAGMVRRAELTTDERNATRARLAGHTWREVASLLGWPDDGKSDERARRVERRALRKVTEALRASEVSAV